MAGHTCNIVKTLNGWSITVSAGCCAACGKGGCDNRRPFCKGHQCKAALRKATQFKCPSEGCEGLRDVFQREGNRLTVNPKFPICGACARNEGPWKNPVKAASEPAAAAEPAPAAAAEPAPDTKSTKNFPDLSAAAAAAESRKNMAKEPENRSEELYVAFKNAATENDEKKAINSCFHTFNVKFNDLVELYKRLAGKDGAPKKIEKMFQKALADQNPGVSLDEITGIFYGLWLANEPEETVREPERSFAAAAAAAVSIEEPVVPQKAAPPKAKAKAKPKPAICSAHACENLVFSKYTGQDPLCFGCLADSKRRQANAPTGKPKEKERRPRAAAAAPKRVPPKNRFENLSGQTQMGPPPEMNLAGAVRQA